MDVAFRLRCYAHLVLLWRRNVNEKLGYIWLGSSLEPFKCAHSYGPGLL